MRNSQFGAFPEEVPYGASHGMHTSKPSLSIFADPGYVRNEICEDAEAAGFGHIETADLTALCQDDMGRPAEVILVHCLDADDTTLEGLRRIDASAANAGSLLVVLTDVDALEGVFASLVQSHPQILVNASRAERLVALGQMLASLNTGRVRELSDADRRILLRLTEQVNQIAQRMEHVSGFDSNIVLPPKIDRGRNTGNLGSSDALSGGSRSAFHFETLPSVPRADTSHGGDSLIRETPLSLPDPKIVRGIIRQRQWRARYFDGDLFADPAWDMLLDLTAAQAERSRVSVTSLCIASGVPPTTALRWIGQMAQAGLLTRNEDKTDRRRAFITMTEKAANAMAGFFTQIGDMAIPVI